MPGFGVGLVFKPCSLMLGTPWQDAIRGWVRAFVLGALMSDPLALRSR
jgi:nucleoside permease NupC